MTEAWVPWKNGAAGWQVFVRVLFVANLRPGGPSVDARHHGDRDQVGVLSINGGDVVLTIRPGQHLVIPDRMRPETWLVK